MNRNVLLCTALAVLLPAFVAARPAPGDFSPVDDVSILVGTDTSPALSQGNNAPLVGRPWGSHFWTAETGHMQDRWIYNYHLDRICGFRMTHQPSVWIGDYGAFALMPVTNGEAIDEVGRASWYTHKREIATPYYYSIYLAEHETTVELTPTSHAARFRMTFPERETSWLVVDAYDGGSSVSIEPCRITGYTVRNYGSVPEGFKMWFVIESDVPFTVMRTENLGEGRAVAHVGFPTKKGQQVNLKVAASFISLEQAQENLREIGDKSFDALKEEGRQVWNEKLGRIRVEDGNIDNRRTFYSCLYRSLLFPHDISEILPDGRRVHRSMHTGELRDGYFYTDTGFWDTFRALFALINWVYPEEGVKMQEGWLAHYLESGFLPEWSAPGHRRCMVGNNSASVVAEAYLKGLRGYDIETLWEAVKKGAHAVHPKVSSVGRWGWEHYDRLGYVPCDIKINESAARTLEYAYDDWCIWALGKALGKGDGEIAPYAKACTNWRNLYREEAGMMSGRNADGSWPVPFNPYQWGGAFTEGNSLQYSWSVFHDPAGLAAAMGGKDKFAAALDNVFDCPPLYDCSYYGGVIHELREMIVMDMGNYAHGNQPAQHIIYLYDWCGQPWKAQQRAREVMRLLYNAHPDGYCGDEDTGQTSAWYVFSAMGFYPVNPAGGELALGSPLFDKVTVSLPSGKKTVIVARDNSPENVYVKALKVNGRSWTRNYVTHKQLSEGATLQFSMSPTPDTVRGTRDEDAPYSFSNN